MEEREEGQVVQEVGKVEGVGAVTADAKNEEAVTEVWGVPSLLQCYYRRNTMCGVSV